MADLTDEQLAEWERDAEELVSVARNGRVDNLIAAVLQLIPALRDARAENERMAGVLSDVFCEQTGGRLSYPTYDSRTVNAEINDARQQEIDAIEAERDSLRAAIEHALEDMGTSTLGAHILRAALAAPTGGTGESECGCARCDGARRADLPWPERLCGHMIVCPECGDKRCPRAAWHANPCVAAPTGQEAVE